MPNRNQLLPYINPPINRGVNIQNIATQSDSNNEENENNINALNIVDMRASYLEPFPRHLSTAGVSLISPYSSVVKCRVRNTQSYSKIRFAQLTAFFSLTYIAGLVYNSDGILIAKTENQAPLQGVNVIITANLLDPVSLIPISLNLTKGQLLYNGLFLQHTGAIGLVYGITLGASRSIPISGYRRVGQFEKPLNIDVSNVNIAGYQLPWTALLP